MKLTYEDKLKIIELYEKGYAVSSIGKKINISESVARRIINRFKMHGKECLKHTKSKKITADIKLEIINKWKYGQTIDILSCEYLVTDAQIRKWYKQYEELGYNGLKIDNRGRPRKMSDNAKEKIKPKKLNESEREELIRLREENKQLEMENYLLKKLSALVQQRNQQSQK